MNFTINNTFGNEIKIDFTSRPQTKTYTRYFNFYKNGEVSSGHYSAAGAVSAVEEAAVEAVAGGLAAIAVPITFTIEV